MVVMDKDEDEDVDEDEDEDDDEDDDELFTGGIRDEILSRLSTLSI